MTKKSKALELSIFERDKNICQGCKGKFPTKYEVPAKDRYCSPEFGSPRGKNINFLVVDHKEGRSNDPSNLQSLCWVCNSSKAGRSENSFLLSLAIKQLGRPMTYYPSLAKVIGLKESIVLCQLIYWTPKGRHDKGDGWIYKSVEQLEEETGLSYKEQLRVRESLVDLALLEEQYDRESHLLYFKVNAKRLDSLGSGHITDGHMPKGKVAPDQKADGICPKVISYKETEITTEITPEKPSASKKQESATDDPKKELKARIREFIQRVQKFKTKLPTSPWNGREGAVLAKMVKDNPSWTNENWKRMLENWRDSDPDLVKHGRRAYLWLPDIAKFATGPVKLLNGRRGAANSPRKGTQNADEVIGHLYDEPPQNAS